MTAPHADDRLMTPAEVAAYYKIDPKTVSRYVAAGRLKIARRTPGGHARFWESDVIAAGQRQSGGAR